MSSDCWLEVSPLTWPAGSHYLPLYCRHSQGLLYNNRNTTVFSSSDEYQNLTDFSCTTVTDTKVLPSTSGVAVKRKLPATKKRCCAAGKKVLCVNNCHCQGCKKITQHLSGKMLTTATVRECTNKDQGWSHSVFFVVVLQDETSLIWSVINALESSSVRRKTEFSLVPPRSVRRHAGLVFLCKAKGILIYNYVASIIIFGYCTEDPADCAGSSAVE